MLAASPDEKRAYKRFKAQEGAFAVINDERKLGPILDIGRGGLSFQYIASEKRRIGGTALDIFFSGHGFSSKSIPIEKVSDFEMEADFSFSSVPMRRCGVRFKKLNSVQVSQLKSFIQKHTRFNA